MYSNWQCASKGGGAVVLNIVPYVWTVRARAFVFQICNPCEKNFYWTRRTLTLWPRPWRTHVYILTFFSVSFLWQLWATHYNFFKRRNHFDTLQGINIESFKRIAWVVIEKSKLKNFNIPLVSMAIIDYLKILNANRTTTDTNH